MKRFIVLFLLCASSFFVYAEQDSLIRCDIGLSTGVPVYSYRDDNVSVKESRIIAGTFVDMSLKIVKPLRFIVGCDCNADFMWDDDTYNYHLDYAGWSGLKYYPGLAGLNFSIAYALGCRTDFVQTCTKSIKNLERGDYIVSYIYSDKDTYKEAVAWGSGFRIGFDYDFLYDNDLKFAPSLGGYYRCMPRGNNNWDNIFAVYVSFGF